MLMRHNREYYACQACFKAQLIMQARNANKWHKMERQGIPNNHMYVGTVGMRTVLHSVGLRITASPTMKALVVDRPVVAY